MKKKGWEKQLHKNIKPKVVFGQLTLNYEIKKNSLWLSNSVKRDPYRTLIYILSFPDLTSLQVKGNFIWYLFI